MKKLRIPVIIILLIFSTVLIYYFRVVHRNEIIFTHLFYLPVILSAFWWQYRGGIVIFYIGAALIVSDFYINEHVMIINDSIRLSVLLLVSFVTAFLTKERMRLATLMRYRSIIASMREPVAIVRRGGEIILKNRKFADLFPEAESGIDCFKDIMGTDDFEEFNRALDRSFEEEGVSLSSYITIADSSKRFFNINFNPVLNHVATDDAVISFWDITENKNTEEMLITAVERQKLVIDVLDLLNKQGQEDDVIRDILSLVKESTAIDFLSILLYQEGKFNLYEMSGSDIALAEKIKSGCPLINGGDVAPGTLCLCSRSREKYNENIKGDNDESGLFWCNDLEKLANSEELSMCECVKEGNFRSSAVIPFSGGNGLLGFFLLFDSNPDFFNEDIINYCKGVVQSIGIALSRSNYEASLRKTIADKEHLIREVHHRVKNNMQVITSLISLQTSRQNDESSRIVLNDCQNRVRAMALVHERLYNSENFSSINFQNYIQTLVPILLNSYGLSRQDVNVKIDVSDINIGISTAIPLAQLINELLSNIFKHAFSKDIKGNVELSLLRAGDGKTCTLNVSDDGCGFPSGVAFPDRGNLGFQLIEALIRQLKGEYNLDNSKGVTFVINFKEG